MPLLVFLLSTHAVRVRGFGRAQGLISHQQSQLQTLFSRFSVVHGRAGVQLHLFVYGTRGSCVAMIACLVFCEIANMGRF